MIAPAGPSILAAGTSAVPAVPHPVADALTEFSLLQIQVPAHRIWQVARRIAG